MSVTCSYYEHVTFLTSIIVDYWLNYTPDSCVDSLSFPSSRPFTGVFSRIIFFELIYYQCIITNSTVLDAVQT